MAYEIPKFIIGDAPVRISSSHSSKGNQLKWKVGGQWVKADCYGYEGLAEVLISQLLCFSNLKEEEYVRYEPAIISYKGNEYIGCVSDNFLKEESDLIPIERIVLQYTSMGLAKQLGKLSAGKERIQTCVMLLERFTGMSGFGVYLTKLLEVDALFLNEDRHTNNISLIYKDSMPLSERFCPSPYYDFGAALFSDTLGDYPIRPDKTVEDEYEDYYSKIQAKPFSTAFDVQLDAAQELFGTHLKFELSREELLKKADFLIEQYQLNKLYSPEIVERVRTTLRMQTRKYSYLF